MNEPLDHPVDEPGDGEPGDGEPDEAAVAEEDDDPMATARKLREQAAAIEAANLPDTHVRLRTGAPHESFTYGGVEVGSEWTPVHGALAPGILHAAGEAGVTVTQEGQ